MFILYFFFFVKPEWLAFLKCVDQLNFDNILVVFYWWQFLLIILKYLFFLRDGLVWKYIHVSVLLLSQSCMLVRLIPVDLPILREALRVTPSLRL